jgi:hypothetical protein
LLEAAARLMVVKGSRAMLPAEIKLFLAEKKLLADSL